MAKRDRACAAGALEQGMKRLRNASANPAPTPTGPPLGTAVTPREVDHVLSSLSKMVKAVSPIDAELGFEVLYEMVEAANRSTIDTGLGRTGFEGDVFYTLAAKDEERTLVLTNVLKDRLSKIVALAAVYRAQARTLKTAGKPANRR